MVRPSEWTQGHTLGPPFLLTGAFYAIAARVYGSQSVVTALLTTLAGFTVFLAGLYLIRGNLAPLGFDDDASGFYDLQVLGVLAVPGFFFCWWLVSDQAAERRASVSTPG